MTRSPKGPWEEVAQRGMPEQIGCPDIRPLGPTVAQLLKAPKVTQATLAGFLAIVKSYYEDFGWLPNEYQGACNVPIPVEVIALIGEKLVGRAQWSREQNDKQAEASAQTRRRVAGSSRGRLAESPRAQGSHGRQDHRSRQLGLRPPADS